MPMSDGGCSALLVNTDCAGGAAGGDGDGGVRVTSQPCFWYRRACKLHLSEIVYGAAPVSRALAQRTSE